MHDYVDNTISVPSPNGHVKLGNRVADSGWWRTSKVGMPTIPYMVMAVHHKVKEPRWYGMGLACIPYRIPYTEVIEEHDVLGQVSFIAKTICYINLTHYILKRTDIGTNLAYPYGTCCHAHNVSKDVILQNLHTLRVSKAEAQRAD